MAGYPRLAAALTCEKGAYKRGEWKDFKNHFNNNVLKALAHGIPQKTPIAAYRDI
jgi:hypothetical protein